MLLAFMVIILQAPGASAQTSSSLKSPNVSANGLFLYRHSNFANQETSTVRNGLDVQEVELSFYADVDPYSRLNLTLSVAPEYNLDETTKRVHQEWKLEPEEAYAESNHIPWTTTKIGKFKAAFGKHNLLHSHAFPLVDAPLVNSRLLGDEGLNDVGVSAAVLVPVSWYSEWTMQALRGEGDNVAFNSANPDDAVGVGHWANLWDLSDSLTMEVGASYARGNNDLQGLTTIWGADLTFKARPLVGGKYQSWIVGGEYMGRILEQQNEDPERSGGGYLWGQYQFAQRWAVAARYDRLETQTSQPEVNPNALDNLVTNKESLGVSFFPSEFSFYRLNVSYADGPKSATGESVEKKIYLQANFTIGAHPSHSY